MNLSQLSVGSSAVISGIGGEGALRQHILDMGVVPGQQIEVVKLAPLGDPMELEIRGYSLTLRLADAKNIDIEPLHMETAAADASAAAAADASAAAAADVSAAASGNDAANADANAAARPSAASPAHLRPPATNRLIKKLSESAIYQVVSDCFFFF